MEAIAKFSKDFMELCWENSIPVVVVEDQEGNLMNIDQFRRMGISTIDHIDTLYGKLSLVSLLYGNSGILDMETGLRASCQRNYFLRGRILY